MLFVNAYKGSLVVQIFREIINIQTNNFSLESKSRKPLIQLKVQDALYQADPRFLVYNFMKMFMFITILFQEKIAI